MTVRLSRGSRHPTPALSPIDPGGQALASAARAAKSSVRSGEKRRCSFRCGT